MSPRALIAEDEPVLRGEVRQALERLWPELEICAEVADGVEAARVVDEQHPEILFLDVAMPGMDGLEVAHRASGRSHVVFITAYDEHAVPAFEEGAVDFLLKPLSIERLRRTVARLQARLG
ncbi:MAG TPA: response regulator, partial [Myxococcaceae bacterium]|nr:response regulator [Myxococcaceae bacterium]